MIFELDPDCPAFPDPERSEDDGLLAVGGDLSPRRLIEAYSVGVFPWYDDGQPLLWWSPDPRMVLLPCDFRCSKSLRRVVRSGRFEVRVDTCFEQVMRFCGQVSRDGQEGTWITEDMVRAYVRLHKMGIAHSFETFRDGTLVGGLYGVSLGDYFCGESMFHTVTDASKVAFAKLLESCTLHGFRFVDAQQETPHLASLGAHAIPRKDFLKMLERTDYDTSIVGRWTRNSVALLIGGNQGDREALLEQAVALIEERIGRVSRLSAVYETEPWGFDAQQNFLNQALVADTDLDAHEVLRRALAIEQELGRVRPGADCGQSADPSPNPSRQYASRPMDIDLIFFNGDIVDTPDLQIPHPRMHLRRFVLRPLCDIMPDYRHPLLGQPVRDLLEACPDKGMVIDTKKKNKYC